MTFMHQVPRRRSYRVRDDGTDSEVIAAGALVWRVHRGELQVLLIHRPRYDDWSFPKGKLDSGESLPECAVREVEEEIRVVVRLGVPLPITRYEVSNGKKLRRKEVWYWAAELIRGNPKPDGKETDDVRWVNTSQAKDMLTNRGDVPPLEELERLHGAHQLRTTPFIVLRHAKAKPRSSWSKSDSERPLAATGKRQAKAVEQLLSAWRPRQVQCSPWKRCAETIAPYVKKHQHRIKYRKTLNEKRARQDPDRTSRRVRKTLELVAPSLVCTHRPVLPTVLDTLKAWLSIGRLAEAIPHEDPYLKPGAVVVAQQARDRSGEVVSIEVYEPFED